MTSPTDSKRTMVARQSFSSSPRLVTPNGTPPNMPSMASQGFPPTFSEARLAQLLSRFDDGTHVFDRTERETTDERRMSFGDALPPHPVHRRTSFLSGLSLSRPGFGFSSSPSSGASTPISAGPKDNIMSSLAMTSTTTAEPEPISRPKSTPIIGGPQTTPARPDVKVYRSNTTPQKGGFAPKPVHAQATYPANEERRHFDPSKEPRLFGLL